tara:strand:+ start:105 stop:467 length:363 start_codon:yes stop_codon:yes gene_type:complete
MIELIQNLRDQGATLRFFNGADWYIELDGRIHVFNTVLQTHEEQAWDWSKDYCSRNSVRDDFDECIESYLDVCSTRYCVKCENTKSIDNFAQIGKDKVYSKLCSYCAEDNLAKYNKIAGE